MSSLPNWHPFVVHFPIALFTTALGCDVILVIRCRRPWLDRAAVLMYVVAALTSGAAALTGQLAADAMDSGLAPDVREAVAAHGDAAFFAVVVLFAVAAMRFDTAWRDRNANEPTLHRMRWAAILVAALAAVVLGTTAGRGGELVYRYGVAVGEHGIIPMRR